MFALLKGIKWFEWIGLGALGLALLTAYGVYNNYDKLKVKFAISEEKVQIANDTINRQVEAAKITDQSLAEHTKETTRVATENAKTRQEAIDEYLDTIPEEAPAVADGAIGQTAEPIPAKVEVPATTVSRVAKAPVKPRTEVSTAELDDRRLRKLADRMHARYCHAYSNGNHCTAQ